MLNAFKIKPFDLQPIYDEWKDGPIFKGNPKKDPPVDEWMDKIKEGCIQRGVPEEYWYKVAQHFMGPKAKARLDEVKAVITRVHGGKYRWTWKKFRVAMSSMGWDIDKSATQTIKLQDKLSNLWFLRKKDDTESVLTEEPESEPASKGPSRSSSVFWPSRKSSVSDMSQPEAATTSSSDRTPPRRSATDFWPSRKEAKDEAPAERPTPHKTNSDTAVAVRARPPPSRSQTVQSIDTRSLNSSNGEVKTVQAPVWLLNACNALDFLTSEHPKAMSVVSAVLITVGSIPALPAITAGAGGAVLASGAAHAIGAIAVGVGQALSMSVKNQQHSQQVQASNSAQ